MVDNIASFYNGKRVFVTGHTGFKGGWLTSWLLKLGADVAGYSLSVPTEPNFYGICDLKSKILSTCGDIRDFSLLKTELENFQPEIVFHLAAQPLVRASYRAPLETFETNIIGTANLLEACKTVSSIRSVVIVTSDKCYENTNLSKAFKEGDPMGGHDPYSSSKACAELVFRSYLKSFFNPQNYHEHRKGVASARAGNVIGGGDWAEDRLIPDCITHLNENRFIPIRYPFAIRPWQHVLDPLYGYLLLAMRLYSDGKNFASSWNFGPELKDCKPVEWIVNYIVKKWGAKASWEHVRGNHLHEAFFLRLDCSKAKKQLEWKPFFNLKTALEKTVEWYSAYYRGNIDMFSLTQQQIGFYEKQIVGSKMPVLR